MDRGLIGRALIAITPVGWRSLLSVKAFSD